MSTKPRVGSANPDQSPDLGNVLMNAPEIFSAFGEVYAEFWQRGIVSQEIKEMTRLRNARITDCGY
ncbi:MAG: hypothetical protein CMP89_01940 [Gammaproteobacteria bacterium]|jgi:hypothetical protein|nr:hypothetical protein [Gammaproteobacteria bacterium]HCC45914.1 hypothetical protein [Gammaproteobacteria bacterium]|tara:strand:+ start:1070 stop:1267 length:198 start_codon:yes stop_codon:yes gene_type:complete